MQPLYLVMETKRRWNWLPEHGTGKPRITTGPIDNLFEDSSGMVEIGDVSLRISLWNARYLTIDGTSGIVTDQVVGGNITTKEDFYEAVCRFLLNQNAYLAQASINDDWLRGILVNGWKSYKISGRIYVRDAGD